MLALPERTHLIIHKLHERVATPGEIKNSNDYARMLDSAVNHGAPREPKQPFTPIPHIRR
jgi:hypothetical protein